ncbi:unnamed protein product, partial [Schistosoma turkestanicum]
SLEFSINIPQLELIFWVSYAKRTGVHVTTGPIQIIGKLKRQIENEMKVYRLIGNATNHFPLTSSSSIPPISSKMISILPVDEHSIPLESTGIHIMPQTTTILHPYVMIPPRLPIQRNGLLRRPIANWCVLNLFASVHDSAIYLRHRDNLPGPLIQMLLQCINTHQNCPNDDKLNDNQQLHNTNHHVNIDDMEKLHTEEINDNAEAFILVPLLRYQQLCPTVLPSNTTVRVHIPGPRSTTTTAPTNQTSNIDSENTNLNSSNIEYNSVQSTNNNTLINAMSTITENLNGDFISTSPVVDEEASPIHHNVVDDDDDDDDNQNNNNNCTTHGKVDHTPIAEDNHAAPPCATDSQLTHEDLTPVHHLEIHEFKMRWTEQHRNLVYILMDSYQHAQSLKKNLSARALHGFRLRPDSGGSSGHTTTTTTTMTNGASAVGKPGASSSSSSGSSVGGTALSRNAHSAIQLTNTHNINNNSNSKLFNSTNKRPSSTIIQQSKPNYLSKKMPTSYELQPDTINTTTTTTTATTTNDINDTDTEKHDSFEYEYFPRNSSVLSDSSKSKLSCFEQIPMLAQLLEEVDTARFYAYCEEVC